MCDNFNPISFSCNTAILGHVRGKPGRYLRTKSWHYINWVLNHHAITPANCHAGICASTKNSCSHHPMYAVVDSQCETSMKMGIWHFQHIGWESDIFNTLPFQINWLCSFRKMAAEGWCLTDNSELHRAICHCSSMLSYCYFWGHHFWSCFLSVKIHDKMLLGMLLGAPGNCCDSVDQLWITQPLDLSLHKK